MLKHNSYFAAQVQSIGFERNGRSATVGVIEPAGDSVPYHFGTDSPERMSVLSGELRANIAGRGWVTYTAGCAFEVPGKSGFDVEAVGGPAAYLCEFL